MPLLCTLPPIFSKHSKRKNLPKKYHKLPEEKYIRLGDESVDVITIKMFYYKILIFFMFFVAYNEM